VVYADLPMQLLSRAAGFFCSFLDTQLEAVSLRYNYSSIEEVVHSTSWKASVHDHFMIKFRDQHFVRSMLDCGASRMVAVVGKGHLHGVEKYWNNPKLLPASKEMILKSFVDALEKAEKAERSSQPKN